MIHFKINLTFAGLYVVEAYEICIPFVELRRTQISDYRVRIADIISAVRPVHCAASELVAFVI
jgi:hypothetical protein